MLSVTIIFTFLIIIIIKKVHRENFCSRGTFVLWNIRSLELSPLWNLCSSWANVPRIFAPSTSVLQERIFQELSLWTSWLRTSKSVTTKVTKPHNSLCAIIIHIHRRRKTLISNRGRWSPLSLFRQVHLGVGKSEYNRPFSGLRAASTWEAVGFCGSHRQTDVLAKLSSWLGGWSPFCGDNGRHTPQVRERRSLRCRHLWVGG